MKSNNPLIITPYKGIAEYITVFLIGKKRIQEENLEIEVVSHIPDDRAEEMLKDREVYNLHKFDWGHWPSSVINVWVDASKLDKPLKACSGYEIAEADPEYWGLSCRRYELSTEISGWEKYRRMAKDFFWPKDEPEYLDVDDYVRRAKTEATAMAN